MQYSIGASTHRHIYGKGITNCIFIEDISKFETTINNRITTPITQEQFDSLISFTYTVGVNNFNSSTLLRKINSEASNSEVAAEYSRWIYQTKIYKKNVIL